MKKNIKVLFHLIGKIVSLVFSAKIRFILTRFRNWTYTGLLSSSFKSCGTNPYVEYPAKIIGSFYIEVGDNFSSLSGLRIEALQSFENDKFTPIVKIGNNVSINSDCHIASINSITIDDNVLIASKVFITDHSHGGFSKEEILLAPNKRKLVSKGSVFIGKNVWIGENVSILGGVEIGENSIVGAGSVVSKNVPPNSIVGGVPAKVIRTI